MRVLIFSVFLSGVLACSGGGGGKASDLPGDSALPDVSAPDNGQKDDARDSGAVDPGIGKHNLSNILLIHHSVGRGILMGYNDTEFADPPAGTVGMRAHVAAYNAAHGTQFRLWDHGYNLSVDYGTGLTDPNGKQTGTDYAFPNTVPADLDPPGWSEQPGGNTTPDGYQALWTSSDPAWTATRTHVMTHEVIAFKSCYYDSRIDTDDVLEVYRTRYLAMRAFMDQHPEKLFVVMSPPPWNPASPEWTDDQGKPLSAEARAKIVRRSRLFANWLKSTTTAEWLSGSIDGFLAGGHPNIVVFDLFDRLAGADNFLRPEYQFNPPGGAPDSHPNSRANNELAKALADFLLDAVSTY